MLSPKYNNFDKLIEINGAILLRPYLNWSLSGKSFRYALGTVYPNINVKKDSKNMKIEEDKTYSQPHERIPNKTSLKIIKAVRLKWLGLSYIISTVVNETLLITFIKLSIQFIVLDLFMLSEFTVGNWKTGSRLVSIRIHFVERRMVT